MKRALILILVLSILTFGTGLRLDQLQQQTALRYLEQLNSIRLLILSDDFAAAAAAQARLRARWQQEAHWLNALLDHHHTRDVEACLRLLATALQEHSRIHALLTVDELMDALEELAQRDLTLWEDVM